MDRKDNNMIAKILEIQRNELIILVRVLFGETEKTLRFQPNTNIVEITSKIEAELNLFIEAESKKNELNQLLSGVEISVTDLNWHDDSYTKRIKILHSQNSILLKDFPELSIYIKDVELPIFSDNLYVYVYCNYILDEHYTLLSSYGAIIQNKD